jgi:hypothetical protein
MIPKKPAPEDKVIPLWASIIRHDSHAGAAPFLRACGI